MEKFIMSLIFRYQGYHMVGYVVLGSVFFGFAKNQIQETETLLGLNAFAWIVISWAAAGIFQAWIVLFWRLELYLGRIHSLFGRSGFTVYRAGFLLFGSIRLVPIIFISFLTKNTVEIFHPLKVALIVSTTPFILWAMYSVVAYFSLNRAFGADHFFPEYREKALEKRGMFRYMPNVMYTVVLLVFYHPGIYFESFLGLISALLHHLFVWVHYFCTEKPDMKHIYSGTNKEA